MIKTFRDINYWMLDTLKELHAESITLHQQNVLIRLYPTQLHLIHTNSIRQPNQFIISFDKDGVSVSTGEKNGIYHSRLDEAWEDYVICYPNFVSIALTLLFQETT